MSILVDTCIWSSGLRKRETSETIPLISELNKLLYYGHAMLTGMVRMEILSGLSVHKEFERVRAELQNFDDFPIETEDYETAASILTLCRSKGIQGSHTDFLLCALSQRHAMPIFTTDKDFTYFARHIKIKLHPIPS